MACVKKSIQISTMLRPLACWRESYLQSNQLGRISSKPDDFYWQQLRDQGKRQRENESRGRLKWGGYGVVGQNKTIQLSYKDNNG